MRTAMKPTLLLFLALTAAHAQERSAIARAHHRPHGMWCYSPVEVPIRWMWCRVPGPQP